jgi:site-specific recombinase XerD
MFYRCFALKWQKVKHLRYFEAKNIEFMITTKIIFDRKKRAKTEGTGTIEVRVTVARRAYYISTGVRVREKEWKAGMIVNRPDAPALNERLAAIYEIVDREVNRCIKAGEAISTDVLKAKVWPIKEAASGDPKFMEWIEKQVEQLTVVYGTKKQYRTLVARLHEFGEIQRWQDVTAENICAFVAWLHQRKKKNGANIIDSAVFKYHRSLKAMLNRAVTFQKIDRNPYELLKGKFKRGDRENVEYLTESEMKAIEQMELPADELMQKTRDLFVFQMYTGLSYSDAQAFDISQYSRDGDIYKHNGERIKTGVAYVSQLLPPAIRVLEKYGMQVPQIENHVYNRELKIIGMSAGIKIPLHSHLARHTFATWMLRNGAKIENVSRMLGHTNIRQTQRYAKVLAESVHEDYAMVAEKMKRK